VTVLGADGQPGGFDSKVIPLLYVHYCLLALSLGKRSY
jgi:hypothetical protein